MISFNIADARKEARNIAQASSTLPSRALDEIALRHGFEGWSRLIESTFADLDVRIHHPSTLKDVNDEFYRLDIGHYRLSVEMHPTGPFLSVRNFETKYSYLTEGVNLGPAVLCHDSSDNGSYVEAGSEFAFSGIYHLCKYDTEQRLASFHDLCPAQIRFISEHFGIPGFPGSISQPASFYDTDLWPALVDYAVKRPRRIKKLAGSPSAGAYIGNWYELLSPILSNNRGVVPKSDATSKGASSRPIAINATLESEAPDPSPERTHLLFLAINKYAFLHPEHDLLISDTPIKPDDAERFELQPLVMLGLALPGLSVRWTKYANAAGPIDLGKFLVEAWRNHEILKGLPDRVVVQRNLADAAPGLGSALASLNIELVIAERSVKALSANTAAAQNDTLDFHLHADFARTPMRNLDQLNIKAALYHISQARLFGPRQSSLERQERWKGWQSLERRSVPESDLPIIPVKIGPWAWAWSSNLSVGPDEKWISKDPGIYWLINPQDDDGNDDLSPGIDEMHDNRAELLKHLLKLWPNPTIELGRASGLRVQDIVNLTKGRLSFRNEGPSRLLELLTIEPDSWDSQYEFAGPGMIFAGDEKALSAIYESCTHGGDANPFEVLPDSGDPDPLMRYWLFNGYGCELVVVVAQRGSAICQRMESILFNMVDDVKVPASMYQDLVRTCVQAALSPQSNSAMIGRFGDHYVDVLSEYRERCFSPWQWAADTDVPKPMTRP